MANTQYVHGSKLRVYKDGRYLGTLTAVSENTELTVLDRDYIGDEEPVHVATTKSYDGQFTRDMNDEVWLETLIGNVVSTKSSVANYTGDADTVKATIDSVTDEDVSFTTPTESGLIVEYVTFNAKKIGSFAGGLNIEIWEGLAGSGTLKATFTCEAADLPTLENEYMTAHLAEADEVALTSNTAHTIRFTAAGAPTGDVELYGNSAETEPYFAIGYEANVLEPADYVIDIVIPKADGTELILRDTGITWTSDGMTVNTGELVSEALGWKAKKRELL